MEEGIWIPISLVLVAVIGLVQISRPDRYYDDWDEPPTRIVIYPGQSHYDEDDWRRYPTQPNFNPFALLLILGFILWLAWRNGWL